MDERTLDRLEGEIETLVARVSNLKQEIGRVFFGHEGMVHQLLVALLCGGHVLIEGVPGLGKTVLVKTLAKVLDLEFRRIQFTPDLMPADILGTNILLQGREGIGFQFEKGPIFGGMVLADEINRATPKTQSALLEAMQERVVTISGKSYELPRPFMVIATQNPIEMEGTYPLPEAQLDRFFFKLVVASPSVDELMAILDGTTGSRSYEPRLVFTGDEVLRMEQLVREVPVAEKNRLFVARMVCGSDPTRADAPDEVKRYLRYGASPRGAQSILLAAKAFALLDGRLAVTREDIEAAVKPALRHRILLNFEAEADGLTTDDVLQNLLAWARRG